MNSPAKMQTVGEVTSSVTNVFKSTFSSLASSLKLPQLRDSFYQNIVYIFIVIIILVGILVYIQMVGTTHINPLNLPPSKEIKNIQIQKVVEGFDMEQNGGIEEYAENISTVGLTDIASGNLYESTYDGAYDGAFGDQYDTSESFTEMVDNDEPNSSRKRR